MKPRANSAYSVTGISIWRWVMIIQILYTGKPVADPSYDISFISVSLEPNTAILAASVPALRSLFKRARTHSPDEEKVPKSPQLEHPPTVGHQPNRNRWQQRIGTLLRTAPPTRQDPIHQCESAKTSMQDFSGTASINYHDMLANMTSDPTRNGSEQTAVEWTKAEHASRTSSPT